MAKNFVSTRFVAIAFVFLITHPIATAQTYDWDGDTDSNWGDPTNWEVEGTGTNPGSAPDATIRTEIAIDSGNTPLIQTGDDFEVGEVRIGRSEGAGLLTMTGGELDNVDNRFRVGSGGVGTFVISGGTLTSTQSLVTGSSTTGNIIMSGGTINIVGSSRDFNMDEGQPAAGSNLSMSAGTINVGDVFLIDGSATVDLSGGSIFSEDDLRVRNDAVFTISGGMFETNDKLEIGEAPGDGGSIFINGGIVRAADFEESVGSTSLLEVNGSGVLQFLQSAQSVNDVLGYILGGVITTNDIGLGVSTVNVGGTFYTQVAVVPEPASVVLFGLGSIVITATRRRNK